MKWIKLFENFTEEDFPKSITIKLTDKFIQRMKEYKSGRDTGFARQGRQIELYYNNGKYNMFKIGTVPFDLSTGIQHDYWISYHPDHNEVYVSQSSASLNDVKKIKDVDVIFSDQPILDEIGEHGQTLFSTGYHSKFDNGFKVGEISDNGYFKIIGVGK